MPSTSDCSGRWASPVHRTVGKESYKHVFCTQGTAPRRAGAAQCSGEGPRDGRLTALRRGDWGPALSSQGQLCRYGETAWGSEVRGRDAGGRGSGEVRVWATLWKQRLSSLASPGLRHASPSLSAGRRGSQGHPRDRAPAKLLNRRSGDQASHCEDASSPAGKARGATAASQYANR